MGGRGHLDAAQTQAAGHSGLYILILKLIKEAEQGLGKGGSIDLGSGTWGPCPGLVRPVQVLPFPGRQRPVPGSGAGC